MPGPRPAHGSGRRASSPQSGGRRPHASLPPPARKQHAPLTPFPPAPHLGRWRTYLRPDVKHPHLEPFTEWEAAVIVQGQKEHANNWLCEPDGAGAGACIGLASGALAGPGSAHHQISCCVP